MVSLSQRARNTASGFRSIWAFDNPIELTLRRVLFRNTGMLTYRKGGMEIVVDHHGGDETGTRECLSSDMYRRLLPLMKLVGSIKLFDIGANGGGFPLLLQDMGIKVGRIAAIEMNPRTFGRMQLNVLQNMDADTVLMNAAICGSPTMLTMNMGRGSTGESVTDALTSGTGTRSVTIEGITFDQAFDRAFGDDVVDLCKLDVEGAEYDVFAQGSCTKLARCRYLIIEIHHVPGKDPAVVVAALKALGFDEIAGSRESHDDVYCFENLALNQPA